MLKEKIIGMMLVMTILSFPSVDGQVEDETIVMPCNDGEITIRYSPVFEIGKEWIVYLEWNDCVHSDNLSFLVAIPESPMGNESRSIELTNSSGEDGIVFQRYTFYEEEFNVLVMFALMEEGVGSHAKEYEEIYIDINETVPDDLRNLWIAMSIFWIGIGGYMKYMYEKKVNIEKNIKALKEETEEDEKKN